MAGKSIKNDIVTRFKTEGAKKAQKDTESVGRSQTRLGQASASTGRQFSAQASGLGGLVAAYAGAAANVFAITQAFAALQRAAQADTIIRGTKTLALEIGQSGGRILASVQKITQGQLTLAEAAQNVNIALSAGFNTEQIEGLTEISLKASRALGRSLTDAFTRVTRGAAKLEPELLDELGIFTRIDPAVEAYASKMNVAASSLTNFEKRQAFVNAVIEEGNKKFSSIDTSVDSPQKSIEQLIATLTDLATEFGQLLAQVLKPIADFFRNNIGNALLLFGGILALVFGKAAQLIGGFVSQNVTNLGRFANALAATGASGKKTREELSKLGTALQVLKKSDVGGAAGTLGRFTTGDAGLNQQLSEIRQRAMAPGGEQDAGKRAKDLKVLKEAREKLNAAGIKGGKQNEFIAKTTRTYSAAVSNLNIAQRAAVGSANLLNIAVRGVGTAFAFAMPFVQGFFAIFGIAQLVASMFDFDILGSIKDFFVDSSQAAANFETGLVGAFAAVAGGAKNLEDQLFGLGASQKQLDELPETLRDIADRFKDVQVVRMVRQGERPNFPNLMSPGLNNPDMGGMPGIVGTQNEVFVETLTDPTIQQRINMVNEAIAKLGDTVEEKLERKLLELYSKSLRELGTNQELIGALSRKLGIGSDKVAESFKEVVKINETGTATFKMLGMTIDNTKDNFSDLTENQQKNIENIFLLNNTLKTASDSFNRGAASSETLSKKLIGATKTLGELRQQIQLLPGEVVTREMLDELEETTQKVKDLEKQVRQLKGLEAIGKSIDTVFGSAIKTFDQALAKGLVSGGGLASKDANQIARTQLNFLAKQTEFSTVRTDAEKEQLEVLKEGLRKRAANVQLDAAQAKAVENRDKALKVAAGRALEFFQNTEKARKAEKKRLDILTAQNGILKEQLTLVEKQNALKEDKATQAAEMQALKDKQSMFKTELNTMKEMAKLEEKRLKLAEKLTAQRAKNLALQNEAAFIRGKAAGRTRLQGIEDDISGAQGRLDTMNRFGNLSSTAQVDAVRKELIDLEFDRQQEVIKQKKAAAQEEYRIQTQLLDDKKGVLEREVTSNRLAEAARLKAVKKEEGIAALNNIMARDKIQNDIDNLTAQTAIAKQQRDISKAQIEADRAKIAADNTKRDADLATLELEQEFTKQMLNANKGLVDNVAQLIATATGKDVSDIRKNLKLDEKFNVATADLNMVKTLNLLARGQQERGLTLRGKTADEKFTGVEDVNKIRKTQLENELSALRKRQKLEGELREAKEKALKQEFSDNQDLLQLKLKGLQDEKDRNFALYEEKKAGFEREIELIEKNKQNRLKALSEEQDLMKNLANDISGVLQNEIGGSVKSLFKAIREGTLTTENFKEGFRDMLANIAGGIADSVLQRTLIDPMNDFISETVGGLFGVEKKGADALTYTGDSANVNVTNMGAGKSIADSVNNDSKSVFDTISEKVGETKDKFVEFLSGLGEKGKEIFSGLGDILSGVFKSFSGAIGGGIKAGGSAISGIIGSVFGSSSSAGANTGAMFGDMGILQGIGNYAAGGRVRNFAAGGMNRDRVPALLEPGEFVMKRSAARSIGEGNLSAMNATGQMGGNVSVNIVNQGTPQEATQQSQPKFDGEKFVIDIVTRDLRNNGPIRKSMRGAS